MASGDEFVKAIRLWVEDTKEDINAVVRISTFKMLGQIVQMSPVGNPELWAVNRRQTNRLKRQAQARAAAYRSDAYSYSMKNGTRKLRKGLKNRLALSDAVYGKNHSDVGPRKTRKMKRAGGEIYRPKGYRGGRFRSNWQVGVGPRPTGWNNDITGPENVVARGEAILQGFDGNQKTIWITNNVPYAVRLEYGHSKQAPNGMVRLTAQRYQQFVTEAAREVRNKK